MTKLLELARSGDSMQAIEVEGSEQVRMARLYRDGINYDISTPEESEDILKVSVYNRELDDYFNIRYDLSDTDNVAAQFRGTSGELPHFMSAEDRQQALEGATKTLIEGSSRAQETSSRLNKISWHAGKAVGKALARTRTR